MLKESILCGFFVCVIGIGLNGQEISDIGNQKPFLLYGGMNMNLNSASTNRDNNRYAPFGYSISAHLSASIYGISLPFSFIYANNNRRFSQPFNRFGISPSYKWIKLHFGHRNVHFNKYTLAGYTVLGAGIELNPGKLRFGFITGRFNKARSDIQGIENYIGPRYDRRGYAIRLGYGTESNHVDLSLLKAKDEPQSETKDSTNTGSPAENLVIGLNTSQKLSNSIHFEADLAFSAYSPNINGERLLDDFFGRDIIEKLIEPRINMNFGFAGDASLHFRQQNYGVSLRLKLIEPGFESMGAYTFLKDVRDITINPYMSILSGDLRLSGSFGLQTNNVSGIKLQKTHRTIGNVNVQMKFSKGVHSSLSYSNYRSEVLSTNEEFLSDSFNILQVSEQARLQTRISLMSGENAQNLNISLFRQKYTSETIVLGEFSNENRQMGISIGYNQAIQKSKLRWNTGMYYAHTMAINDADRITFRASISKELREKWRLSSFLSGGIMSYANTGNAWHANIRGAVSYQITSKQTASISLSFLGSKKEEEIFIYQNRLNLRYGISF